MSSSQIVAAGDCFADQFEKFFPKSSSTKPEVASSEQRQYPVVELRNEGNPLTLYVLPTERSPIAGEGTAPSKFVEMLGGCSQSWCYVRVGSAIGWLDKNRLTIAPDTVASITPAPQDDRADRAAKVEQLALAEPPPVPDQAASPPSQTYLFLAQSGPVKRSEPASRDLGSQEDADTESSGTRSIAISDIQKKTYSLAGLEGGASLPVRGYHDENSPVLGSIPASAKDVEATGLCVEEWCLVRRGSLRGWIKRRYLIDEARAAGSRSFGFNGPAPWSVLDVYDYPRDGAEVVGQIPSPAKAIELVEDCGKDWCHIRYFNTVGWVRAGELEPL